MQTTVALGSSPFSAWKAVQIIRYLSLALLGACMTGCASLPSRVDRPVSTALADPLREALRTLPVIKKWAVV